MGEATRRLLLEAIIFVALSAAAIVLVADVAYARSLTWSRIPLGGIGLLAISGLAVVIFPSRPYVVVILEVIAVSLFLLLIDLSTPGLRWFVPLGLPITLAIGSLLLALLAMGRWLRLSHLAAVAASLVASGLLALVVELAVNRFSNGVWFVSWSLVVCGCVLPLVPLLLMLRRWVRKNRPEIEKILHL